MSEPLPGGPTESPETPEFAQPDVTDPGSTDPDSTDPNSTDPNRPAPPRLDPTLLEILRDPEDRSELTMVEESGAWYLEGRSGNRYPITDGIPVLLLDAAHTSPPA